MENTSFSEKRKDPYALVTADPQLQDMLATARRIAPSDAAVLLYGESGTGKELLARFIHANSRRNDGPFQAINCAALPESLAESELFGFEKGAFTGAVARKTGKFESAHNGTLLLDEISEMPILLQPKLLRVLQEKKVCPIGGHQALDVNARIIATTNCSLPQMIQEGKFRQDLYYRLRVIPFHIPPLRERQSDIPLLIDHFVALVCKKEERSPVRFSDDAMKRLMTWHWPGNVRELENTIQRAVLICTKPMIGPEHLLLEEDLEPPALNASARLVGMTVKELEQKLIEQTLAHVNQNRTHASELLGISIRTLRNKLNEYRATCSKDIHMSAVR